LKIKKEIATDAQAKLEQSNGDYKELEKKYWRLVDEKENVEKNAKEDFKRLQDMINKKQREMQEIQSKYLNYVDYDLEQKKIENRLELKYGKEIEDKQRAVDSLNKALNDLIRDHEICKAKLNSIQKDNETNLAIVKDSNKKQVDLLLKEIQDYQEQKLFNDYKDKYNEVRIKRDELERKNELLEKELEECRNELQQAKNRHNDLLITGSKDLEKVRNESSGHKIERDRLLYKNQALEQENVELRGQVQRFREESRRRV
jgi:chromosome segregation ATPase